jgi:hypothetical protein
MDQDLPWRQYLPPKHISNVYQTALCHIQKDSILHVFPLKIRYNIKIRVFWIVTQCSLVERYQRIGGICCLLPQSDHCVTSQKKLNSVVLVCKRSIPSSTCRRRYCQHFADRECRVFSTADPHCSILAFLDWSRYFFFQVAPQLYSRGWVDPVPDPLLLRKSGSARNLIWTSGSVARNSDH